MKVPHSLLSLFTSHADPVPIAWDYDSPTPIVDWPIFEYEVVTNSVLGIPQIIWTDEPMTIQVPVDVRSTPFNPPKRPYAYFVPAEWTEAIDKLAIHGIEMEVLTKEMTLEVVSYRMDDYSNGSGRENRLTAFGTPVPETCTSPTMS